MREPLTTNQQAALIAANRIIHCEHSEDDNQLVAGTLIHDLCYGAGVANQEAHDLLRHQDYKRLDAITQWLGGLHDVVDTGDWHAFKTWMDANPPPV